MAKRKQIKPRKPNKVFAFLKTNPHYFWLGIIMLIALFMRLYQPDWYQTRQFHPDERWIVSDAVASLHVGKEPSGLQYGSLPLYLLSIYRDGLDTLNKGLFGSRIDMGRAVITGARAFSGIVDAGTIILIFMLAALLFGNRIALLASLLLAFTPLHIHSAHFFTVDTFLTLFVVATLYFSARIYKYGKMLDYILAGVFYAAAIASKTSALPAVAAILVGHILYLLSIKGNTASAKAKRQESWINLGITIACTAIAFFLFMPYAILDHSKFLAQQSEQQRILVTGEADVPYNRQYINTTPYLFFFKNLILYTMGIPYGTAAVFAFLFYLTMLIADFRRGKKISMEILIIMAWLVPYFFIVGKSYGKFNRYMLPMTPFLAILTAKLIYDFYGWVKDKKWAATLRFIVAAGAIFYGVAFMNVYFNSHTWIQASTWIYDHVPGTMPVVDNRPVQLDKHGKPIPLPPMPATRQTIILNEMWGDDLPTGVEGRPAPGYQNSQWALQEPDSPRKLDDLSDKLSKTDYVMMADKRAYGTYLRIPERYPINYFYYHTMMTEPEKFGYKRVYEKAVYPSLFGINIKDDKADESFQLYDHPHVFIFKNDKYMDTAVLKNMILEGSENVKKKFAGKIGYGNPNMGAFRDKVAAILPAISVFLWYLMVQLIAFVALPLNFIIFKNMPDKGYALSKISGLFLFTFINWIFVSFGVWNFYQFNLWLLLLAAGIASAAYYMGKKKEMLAYVKSNSRHILINETIFLGAFMFFVIIKLWAPDIHNIAGQGYNGGGEPMGMAYLSAIFNDVKFPPHDPWLSGYTLNYYYWGQLMLATLSKILGYMPRITYNLSLALLFALCFIGAFSVCYNITRKYKFGLLGGFLLAMAGNYHTLVYTFESITGSANVQQFLNNFFRFEFIWNPTRIYPTPVITEVPFFSYLYGDLHAHNIVIPVTVLFIALAYNVIKANNNSTNILNNLGTGLKEQAITFLVIAVTMGSMLPMNTWNFPPVVLFGVIIFAAVAYLTATNMKKSRDSAQNIKNSSILIMDSLFLSVVVIVVSYILFLPFHKNFQSPYKTVAQVNARTEWVSLFVMFKYFSVFFFVIFAYMLNIWIKGIEELSRFSGVTKLKSFDADKVTRHFLKAADKIFANREYAVKFSVSVIAIVVFAGLAMFLKTTFGFLFLMLLTLAWQVFKTKDKEEMFSLLSLLVALSIITGTEVFYIADGRMNTVFKFYMVTWVFLSVGLPYILYKIIEEYKKIFAQKKDDERNIWLTALGFLIIAFVFKFIEDRSGTPYFQTFTLIVLVLASSVLYIMKNKIGKYVFMGAFIFVMLPSVMYPFIGGLTKMSICSDGFKQPPRIDGMKYIQNLLQRGGSPRDFDKYDYQAIEWINSNIPTIEPILEAPGQQLYSGVSRISIFTGMPTYVGWEYQVSQQSGRSDEISRRDRTANLIFSLPDIYTFASMLKDEDLHIVYVGSIEKSLFPSIGKFDEAGSILYQNDGAKLHFYDFSRLTANGQIAPQQ